VHDFHGKNLARIMVERNSFRSEKWQNEIHSVRKNDERMKIRSAKK